MSNSTSDSSSASLKLALAEDEFKKHWYKGWCYVALASLVPSLFFWVFISKIISNEEISPAIYILSPIILSFPILVLRGLLYKSVREFKISRKTICVTRSNGKVDEYAWSDLTSVNLSGNVFSFTNYRRVVLRYGLDRPLKAVELHELWLFLLGDSMAFQRVREKARIQYGRFVFVLAGVFILPVTSIFFYESRPYIFYFGVLLSILCFYLLIIRYLAYCRVLAEIGEYVKSVCLESETV